MLTAREILAIPASEVDCKRLFSEGRDLLGVRRYTISRETMRTMILLKGALRSQKEILNTEKPIITGLNTLYIP